MASLADKNLSQAAQDKINKITADAQAGKTTWAEANKAANEIRASEGANYSVSAKGDTSYKDGSSISSNKTGNKVSGGGSAQKDYEDYGSNSQNTVVSSGNTLTTGTTWQPGIATTGTRPDMSRHSEYAGLSVKQGHYTVTYNSLGYATKAVQDNGASANATMKTTHANDSIYHQEAYQAAQRGDWDAVGNAINKIAMAGGTNQYGNYDMTDANRYYGELVNEFQYNAQDYYNKLYDQAYGENSAAIFDATGGAIKSYQSLVDAVGEETAQRFLKEQTGNSNGGTLPGVQYPDINYGGSGTSGGSTGGTTIPDTSGGTGGTGNTGGTVTNTDLTDYLKELYAKNLEAQLANLKSTYDTNVADLEAQQKDIKQQFQSARNQTAAQYDLGRMRFNEYALANGLNTGTAGQGVLAQSAAYQGNLADIGSQEASAMSDNSLQLTKLEAQYNAAINEAKATGDFQLAQALYDELVRQENVAIQQQQAALDQQNWERQFAWQQQQANLSQSNWERQFAYQQMLNGQDYSVTQQQLAAQAQERAYDYAMTLLSSGVMPDSVTLNSAGISANEAALMQQIVLASKGQTTNKSGSTTSTARNPSTTTGGYNNGSLTTAQVKQLQQKLGVTADGKWGSKSSTAAGGLTADEAWAKYGGYDMSFEELKSTLTRYLSLGGAQRAQNILDAHWDSLTPAQQLELSNLFG